MMYQMDSIRPGVLPPLFNTRQSTNHQTHRGGRTWCTVLFMGIGEDTTTIRLEGENVSKVWYTLVEWEGWS